MKPENIEKAKELCRDLSNLKDDIERLKNERTSKDTDEDSGYRHIHLMDRNSYSVPKDVYLKIIDMIDGIYSDEKKRLIAEINEL